MLTELITTFFWLWIFKPLPLCQAAVEEGIVVGGGCTLLRLAARVDAIKDNLENDEQKVYNHDLLYSLFLFECFINLISQKFCFCACYYVYGLEMTISNLLSFLIDLLYVLLELFRLELKL